MSLLGNPSRPRRIFACAMCNRRPVLRLYILSASALAFAAPAYAQSSPSFPQEMDREIVRSLPSPGEVESMAGAAGRAAEAILDVPVGGIVRVERAGASVGWGRRGLGGWHLRVRAGGWGRGARRRYESPRHVAALSIPPLPLFAQDPAPAQREGRAARTRPRIAVAPAR